MLAISRLICCISSLRPREVNKCTRISCEPRPPVSSPAERKELITFSYAKDTSASSLYAACVKFGECAMGDRHVLACARACAHVCKRRKGRSDEAVQRERGTQDGKTRGRDREKKKGGTKDGSVDGKMLPGVR